MAPELSADLARDRLAGHDHGILATVHPTRGVDAVPVAYALEQGPGDGGGDLVGIPVDRVKPKTSPRLQRQRNLEADPRATLLIEHWDPVDWSRLWWVRARLEFVPSPAAHRVSRLATGLAERYPQYRDRPFTQVLVLHVVELTGWTAQEHRP